MDVAVSTSRMEADMAYRLTTSFPYLARRVGIRIGELFDRRIAELGITVSMYRVLASLLERDGQRLGSLSDMTSIELSTLSRLVGTMTRKGLVSRKRPRGNARVVEISLTGRGRTLALQLTPIAEHFEEVALSGLSAKAVAELKHALDRAFTNLDRLERELSGNDAARSRGPARAPQRPTARSDA